MDVNSSSRRESAIRSPITPKRTDHQPLSARNCSSSIKSASARLPPYKSPDKEIEYSSVSYTVRNQDASLCSGGEHVGEFLSHARRRVRRLDRAAVRLALDQCPADQAG